MTGRKLLYSKFSMVLLAVAVLVAGYFFSLELKKRMLVENEISGINQQIAGLQENNRQLSDLISYLRSSSFQEKEIRRKLNLQKPGEHAIALPQAASDQSGALPEGTEAQKVPNWKLWWNYFFASQS